MPSCRPLILSIGRLRALPYEVRPSRQQVVESTPRRLSPVESND